MSELTKEEKETFDVSLCKPETYAEIDENLSYYKARGDTKAIEAFQSLKTEMEQKCDMVAIRRSLNGFLPRHTPTPTPRKFTMNGFDIIEIHPDGTFSLYIPEQKKVKIQEPIPECLLALRALPSKEVKEYEDPLIRNKNVPKLCDPSQCEILPCPQRLNIDQHGKLCIYRTPPNQRTPQVDPLDVARRTHSLSDPINEPEYKSPM